jgi:hypothetical protein
VNNLWKEQLKEPERNYGGKKDLDKDILEDL